MTGEPRQFVIVDAPNLFHRSRHVAQGSVDDRAAMCIHIMFSIILRMWRRFKGSHVAVCFDSGSWRTEFHPPYKQNRRDRARLRTQREIEDDAAFQAVFDEFREFADDATNMSVLQADGCEADDFIAHWIRLHPDDRHVIVSTDSDFHQLVSETVWQYSSVKKGRLFRPDGIFDDDGDRVTDPRTGDAVEMEDPEWLLFEKVVRGDSTDNIFPAYPRVRRKGSRNKVGLQEAFDNRHERGFAWNNLMLQCWTDHHGVEHVVRDDYERNRTLIDLSMQPAEIKERMDAKVAEEIAKERRGRIGIRFIKFCNRHRLERLSENARDHAAYLSAQHG